ncbi:scarecrow-like protein 3 [Ipomoea triloba]|uniref:scarecrow-like protein 3 n=1 Tax=Ipomoea triloba TaxID=35885 RepID=UPI00125CECE7|nr:scarecrow-like protein 3 [Ipomoea triloba]
MFQDNDGSSSITSLSPRMPAGFGSLCHWFKELKPEERGLYLIHLLLTCANHVAGGALDSANVALDQISHLASPDGDTMQRIASYFAEALADRILRSWPGLYKALHSTRLPVLSDQVTAKKILYDLFPFLKVAFMVTNQAIIEAMEGEKLVHIIDLNAAEPTQWRPLLQDLSARPEGPPHLRITGVHPHREPLDQMARALTDEAEKLDIPFQFTPIVTHLETLDFQQLRVKTGEALAITSSLKLHTLLAHNHEPGKNPNPQRLGDNNFLENHKIKGFLDAIRGLSPKIVVISEQESNHNGETLMQRLSESLHYYAAFFDCLESTLPRTSSDRLKAEKLLLGEEIKNIIACEGIERKERHEKLDKWFWRFGSSGFWNVPLSYYAMLQARRYLQSCRCDGYNVKEENGCVVICWQDRALFSVSCWRCRR